jgi:hypothetical protein
VFCVPAVSGSVPDGFPLTLKAVDGLNYIIHQRVPMLLLREEERQAKISSPRKITHNYEYLALSVYQLIEAGKRVESYGRPVHVWEGIVNSVYTTV